MHGGVWLEVAADQEVRLAGRNCSDSELAAVSDSSQKFVASIVMAAKMS